MLRMFICLIQVKVMSSIQKPKRISICGNDSKEYQFLVKGGEDLRLDQRIEQLFSLMNQIFSNDPMCRQRKLTLRTYQVRGVGRGQGIKAIWWDNLDSERTIWSEKGLCG